ncbi:MAG: HAD-IIIA family hydrolase, partial [Deltaproteobacteria bacterium]|nr:HAD-IIIA family hydrolase [Deltaproteobacteria bacterium]
MGKKAVFLDRDGTINVDTGYIGTPEGLKLFPGAAKGIRMLSEAGFILIVISNQSGIGRGYFTEDDLGAVNGRITELLTLEGAALDA